MKNIIEIMPPRIADALEAEKRSDEICEIRLRTGKNILVRTGQREYGLNRGGLCTGDGFVFLPGEADALLRSITGNSPYAAGETLREGYITIKGGHRLGVGGELISRDGEISAMGSIGSFCVRRARAVQGCFERIRDCVTDGGLHSTLVFSPPGCGKTTLLRDACRVLSNAGYNVAVIDERCEIAACFSGVPAMEVGRRTDVLSGCPKCKGINMAVRALSPDVIVTDELAQNDTAAVAAAAACGVGIIASAHAGSIKEALNKGYGVFSRFVGLDSSCGPGTVSGIYDAEGKSVRVLRCCI